jgi:hypothetical protein
VQPDNQVARPEDSYVFNLDLASILIDLQVRTISFGGLEQFSQRNVDL